MIASLKLALAPNDAKRGKAMVASVTLTAFDATGAQIAGPSDFATPISLSIQGDVQRAFRLHAGGKSGSSLSIVKPTAGIQLTYDGNVQAFVDYGAGHGQRTELDRRQRALLAAWKAAAPAGRHDLRAQSGE